MAVLYVNQSAVGENDGSSWLDAHLDLQDAIAAANPGDEIWVAQGTYRPTDNTDRSISFVLKDEVAIYGGFEGRETSLEQRDWSNNATILSGDIGTTNEKIDNTHNVVFANNVNDAVVDGFSIVEGNALDNNEEGFKIGSGIYSFESRLSLKNLLIENNQAEAGGGVMLWNSQIDFSDVALSNNIADRTGGGIYQQNSNSQLKNVTWTDNVARESGGGFYNLGGNAVFEKVFFDGNRATNFGGGIFNHTEAQFKLEGGRLENNRANEAGGAIFNGSESTAEIINSRFRFNQAERGGAISTQGNSSGFNDIDPTITTVLNSLFDSNSAEEEGGAIHNFYSNSLYTNATFVQNIAEETGAVFFFEGNDEYQPLITNSLIFNNGGIFETEDLVADGSNPVVSFSLLEGGYEGIEVIDENPLFVNSEEGDYRLARNSPGIDFGKNEANEESADLAGNPRVSNQTIDVGAYEFVAPLIGIEDVTVSLNQQESAEFEVQLIDSNGEPFAHDETVTVQYATEDETALAGEDYTATAGSVTFEPGETEQTISVELNSAIEREEDTRFSLRLSEAENASLEDALGRGTIVNSLLDTTIYRFQNLSQPGTYLYVRESERAEILRDFPEFIEEGIAFQVGVEPGDGLIPLYRFQSEIVPGTYLFVEESERNQINQEFAESFTEEGLAFYVYGVGSGRGTDFSRFQNSNLPGTYLFATGEERENIRVNFPDFNEEGIAFEVEI